MTAFVSRSLFVALLALSAASLFGGAAGPAEPQQPVSFVAMQGSGNAVKVRMINNVTGVAAWMSLGEVFGGYTITGFDPTISKTSQGTLLLTRDGFTTRLSLAAPKVRSTTNQPNAAQAAAVAAAQNAAAAQVAAMNAPGGPVPLPAGAVPPAPPTAPLPPGGSPGVPVAPAAAMPSSGTPTPQPEAVPASPPPL